jgi:hypothetical protein
VNPPDEQRRRAGEALAHAAPDLARVWRTGRAASRPAVFPGLLDAIVEPFLTQVGEGLAAGRDPVLVWPAVEGLIRLDGRDGRRTTAELDAEWDLIQEVLEAACRALATDESLLEWVSRAVVIARAGCRNLPQSARPGVVTVQMLSPMTATRAPRGRGPR